MSVPISARHHPRRDRDGGPAARAAGDHRRIPGVAGGAGDRVVVRDAEGELVHVGLRAEERSGVEEGRPRPARSAARPEAREGAGSAARREGRRVDVVLEGQRDAGERAAGTGSAVHGPRRREQRVPVVRYEGVEPGHRLGARDERLDVLAAHAHPRTERGRGLHHGQLDEFVSRTLASSPSVGTSLPPPRGSAPSRILGTGGGSAVSSFLRIFRSPGRARSGGCSSGRKDGGGRRGARRCHRCGGTTWGDDDDGQEHGRAPRSGWRPPPRSVPRDVSPRGRRRHPRGRPRRGDQRLRRVLRPPRRRQPRRRPGRALLGGRRWQPRGPYLRRFAGAGGALRKRPRRPRYRRGRPGSGHAAPHSGADGGRARHMAGGRRLRADVHRLRSEGHRVPPRSKRSEAHRHRPGESGEARRDRGPPARHGGRTQPGGHGGAGRSRLPPGDARARADLPAGSPRRGRPVPAPVHLGHGRQPEGSVGSPQGAARVRRLHEVRHRPPAEDRFWNMGDPAGPTACTTRSSALRSSAAPPTSARPASPSRAPTGCSRSTGSPCSARRPPPTAC